MLKIVIASTNDNDSLQNLISNADVNRFGGYFTLGRSCPPAKIAEFVDEHHQFQCFHGREPTLNEFMEVSKIGGRDLALKIIHYCKHNVTLVNVKQGHRHIGPLSRIECFNEGIGLDLHMLCLDWPSRPARSCCFETKEKHGVHVSHGTVIAWFNQNKQHKCVFC